MKIKINDRNATIFLIIAAVFLLASPIIIKYIHTNSAVVGDDSYYNLRLINNVFSKENSIKDGFVERSNFATPYHFLMKLVGNYFNIEIAAEVFQLILGLCALMLFYAILTNFKVNLIVKFLSSIILILSPAYIWTFATINPFGLSIVCLLTAIYGYLSNDARWNSASFALFLLLMFFGITSAVTSIAVLISLIFLKKNMAKKIRTVLVLSIALFAILIIIYIYFGGLPQKTYEINPFKFLISDFGSLIGFGIFEFILLIYGIILTWKMKKEFVPTYISIAILSIFGFYMGSYVNSYISFIAAVFAAIGFGFMIKRKWEMTTIKNLTILVLFCGLLFSTISYINRLSNSLPDEKIIDSLVWLKSASNEGDVIFSDSSRGLWIEYFSERKVLLDDKFIFIKNADNRFKDSSKIFYSRNLKETRELLNKYEVKYIFIDESMKKGIVWNEEQEGLLFLFRNPETFKNIYLKDGIEIWEYIGK